MVFFFCWWAGRLFRVQVDGNDQTVQTQYFGENEDQDHTDEQAGLLSCASYTCVTNDANGKTGRQTGETDRQTRT